MESFETISELEEQYLVKERKLNEFQHNFSGIILDGFEIIKPIKYFSFKTGTGNAGWETKNIKTGRYEILPNVIVVSKYNDLYAKEEYFGIRYTDKDSPFNMSKELIKKQLVSQKDKVFFISDFDKRMKQNLEMFDNNIDFFNSLDNGKFNTELLKIVHKYHFFEIQNTSGYKNCLYILVFDGYKQFYVGSAKSLSNRTKKHWNAIMDFSRFTWIGLEHSRLNVDTFRMKDNTRIFVCTDINELLEENRNKLGPNLEKTNTFGVYKFDTMSDLEKAERIVINDSPVKYCLSDRIPIDSKFEKIQDYLDNK